MSGVYEQTLSTWNRMRNIIVMDSISCMGLCWVLCLTLHQVSTGIQSHISMCWNLSFNIAPFSRLQVFYTTVSKLTLLIVHSLFAHSLGLHVLWT
jgi:hypothetical protein